MSNYHLIQSPSTILANQADILIKDLVDNYADYTIQSTLDLAQYSAATVQSFYRHLGQPLLSPLVFTGIPIAELWNSYQKECAWDLGVLYDEAAAITTSIQKSLLFSNIENLLLVNSATILANQVTSFDSKKPTTVGQQRWVASDDFYDTSKVDTVNTTADITNGTVELARSGSVDYSSQIALMIDDEYVKQVTAQDQLEPFLDSFGISSAGGVSNGFLGNTHEVSVAENTNTLTSSADNQEIQVSQAVQLNAPPGESISFVGDAGIHGDITVVLDGNPTTWFEYEVCNIPDSLKQNPCLGYGFTFTLGQSTPGGGVTDIPWYAFHDGQTKVDPTTQTPTTKQYPPPPTTSNAHPYAGGVNAGGRYVMANDVSVDPQTGQVLNNSTSNQNNPVPQVLPVSGAPRTGGVLRLAVNGMFQTDMILSQISVLPNVFNGKSPVVKSIQVKGSTDTAWTDATPSAPRAGANNLVDVSGKFPQLPSGVTSDQVDRWVFVPRAVKYVRVVLEQPESYDTDIGHIVWVEQDTAVTVTTTTTTHNPGFFGKIFGGKSHTDSSTTTSTNITDKRVDGPKPSIENLVASGSASGNHNDLAGAIVGGAAGGVVAGPVGIVVGAVIGLISGIGSFLFGSSSTSVSTQTTTEQQNFGPFLEYFSGWRYVIGLRDISFGAFQYATSSILVSKDFEVGIDIKKVTLLVHEDIPHSTMAPDYTTTTEWITYDISLDGGASWFPIAPQSHYFSSKPQVYVVNPLSGPASVPSASGSITTSGYDSVNAPVTSIRMRATFTRPSSVPSLSPQLHRYQINLEGAPVE